MHERYQRQIILPEVGNEGQLRLRKASILIIGMGGLGCPAAQYLAAAGVGHIGLMDHDQIDLSNLHRQILFSEKHVGQSKAKVACEVLQALNPNINITDIHAELSEDNAIDLFKTYDLILDGTDNFQSKYLINDACIKTGKPFIGASIYRYQGQLSVFNYEGGPSYRCLYPDYPQKDNISCEETGVLGVLPGMMGVLQATEALKMILKIGNVLSGRLKIIDMLSSKEQLINFHRNDEEIERIKIAPLKVKLITCEIAHNARLYLDVRELYDEPVPTNGRLLRIPISELKQRINEVPRDEKVHVFCQSGNRSREAILLLESGFQFNNLVDAGGIDEIIT
ncbi:MAG: molybdopterin/thiamine biosynthesis adenylyltransferase [Marinoscillum sp.]|jgi:molybdopterin/thiamine biosynthesis adenylyltransferase